MDYYKRGSLADIMSKEKRTLSEQEIQVVASEILTGLAYLH
jgi:serine/threonine protein kinase